MNDERTPDLPWKQFDPKLELVGLERRFRRGSTGDSKQASI